MEPQKNPSSPSDDKPNPEPTSPFGTPPIDQTDSAASAPAPQTNTFAGADTGASDADKSPVDAGTAAPAEPFAIPQTFKPDMGGDALPTSSMPTLTANDSSSSALPPMSDAAVPGSLPFMAAKPRKKGLLMGAIIAAVVVVLLGGASAAYYYVATTKPENVLLQALANSLDEDKAQTMHISGSLGVTDDTSDLSLNATYTGAFDDKTGAMDISAKLDAFVTNMTFDVRSTDGKTAYLKLGGLNGLQRLLSTYMGVEEVGSVYGTMITAVNDQWLEVNESLIKQATGSSLNERLSKADREKLAKTYQDNAFLVVKQVLADEKIKGANSHHYKIVIDKTRLKAFAAALKNANIASLKITNDELKAFNDSIKDAPLDKYPVDLWIAKSSKMITQMAITASEQTSTVNFSMTVDSYNKPVTVEKPVGAKSILEVLGTFEGAQSSSDLLMPELEGLDSGVSL